jgi:hypothetical protein
MLHCSDSRNFFANHKYILDNIKILPNFATAVHHFTKRLFMYELLENIISQKPDAQQSAVSSQKSAVSSQKSAVRSQQSFIPFKFSKFKI